MYLFYFDESGSRDPSAGTLEKPKDHIYVLLAIGMFHRQWRTFESTVSGLKMELADYLFRDGKGRFELADCEIKSNWIRIPAERRKKSRFLSELHGEDMDRLIDTYFNQVSERNMIIVASVIDKRYLHAHTTHESLHMKAYEFALERIQHYMKEYHPKHKALIIMDDTSKQLNRAVAMKHASFQRSGNANMMFPAIVEYPFFTRSELSNGVQLADLLAYNVYRAFKSENINYEKFHMILPGFYRRRDSDRINGLKVWPNDSLLIQLATGLPRILGRTVA